MNIHRITCGRWLRRFATAVAILAVAGIHPVDAGGEQKAILMPNDKACTESAVARSICVLKRIMDDIAETYPEVGGGGITSIRLETSSLYIVAIAQEERIDLLSYEFEIAEDGEVHILSRTAGVESPN